MAYFNSLILVNSSISFFIIHYIPKNIVSLKIRSIIAYFAVNLVNNALGSCYLLSYLYPLIVIIFSFI